MSSHKPVPTDAATEIRELSGEGYGRNTISMMTGVCSSTVRNVLDGTAVEFSEDLTTRQISTMLCTAFRPVDGR